MLPRQKFNQLRFLISCYSYKIKGQIKRFESEFGRKEVPNPARFWSVLKIAFPIPALVTLVGVTPNWRLQSLESNGPLAMGNDKL